jgi:hypothetical protein
VSTPEDRTAAGERAYFRLADASWEELWPAVGDRLLQVHALLSTVVETRGAGEAAPRPGEVALELGTTARAIFEALAPEESSLREVITTLRTALALCWDMYSYPETDRVTVRTHMERLQRQIEGFEADLSAVQEAGDSA